MDGEIRRHPRALLLASVWMLVLQGNVCLTCEVRGNLEVWWLPSMVEVELLDMRARCPH